MIKDWIKWLSKKLNCLSLNMNKLKKRFMTITIKRFLCSILNNKRLILISYVKKSIKHIKCYNNLKMTIILLMWKTNQNKNAKMLK